MQALNSLESVLLEKLVTKYPSFAPHLPYLKVEKREAMGEGICVHLVYENPDSNLITEDRNALFSNGERIVIKELKYGLGYVIDITDGEIKFIEFIPNGETWNGKFSEYNILEKES